MSVIWGLANRFSTVRPNRFRLPRRRSDYWLVSEAPTPLKIQCAHAEESGARKKTMQSLPLHSVVRTAVVLMSLMLGACATDPQPDGEDLYQVSDPLEPV